MKCTLNKLSLIFIALLLTIPLHANSLLSNAQKERIKHGLLGTLKAGVVVGQIYALRATIGTAKIAFETIKTDPSTVQPQNLVAFERKRKYAKEALFLICPSIIFALGYGINKWAPESWEHFLKACNQK